MDFNPPLLRVLILGSGGREHALAWKIAQSTLVEKVYVAPGNAGTKSKDDKFVAVPIPVTDFRKLVEYAVQNEVSLVVAGPEQPLVDGIEPWFRKVGIHFFGPSPRAAQMEGSKAFAKEFMRRHQIPTATYKIFFKNDYEKACAYVKNYSKPIVLKASGLAAGKGVLIPQSKEEALEYLKQILVDSAFGTAGDELVIEDYLTGPEVSVLAFSDGYTVIPLPAAQDHKRIGDGDTGPNTGGMGAYAPAPIATPEIMRRIVKETLQPTIDGMRREGFPFVGLLFTGFIITEDGPKVLEYNVRFGDPETEALMLLLDESIDLATIMLACVERRLDAMVIKNRPGTAVSVVLASAGYPGKYETRKVITFPADETKDTVIFHAGTALSGDDVVTAGGRVLAVTAYGPTLQEALSRVYAVVAQVHFDGKSYRKDIAHRALATSTASKQSLTYADAGVSIDAGNDLVRAIKPLILTTRRPGSDAEIGGFGGVFDLARAGYKDPILVSGTDGVGTKLRVAMDVGKHDTVGIDLVAMSVNDLIVQGAEPLYFLDYYACGKLSVNLAKGVVSGIVEGCRESGCALIGGETAEMPGMYVNDDYDLAGFAVGAVERDKILPLTDAIELGDVLIGISSSGLHSNGFSLVRKILSRSSLSYASPAPWNTSRTLGEEFLIPTRLYPKLILHLLRSLPHGDIKGIVNITGGGFTENIPRVLPRAMGVEIDRSSWVLPPLFDWLRREGALSQDEMCKTFNCGIGMALIVSRDKAEAVRRAMSGFGDYGEGIVMGRVTASPGVVYSSGFLV